jgi:hypothetical protein
MEAIVGVVQFRALTIWITALCDGHKVRESNSRGENRSLANPVIRPHEPAQGCRDDASIHGVTTVLRQLQGIPEVKPIPSHRCPARAPTGLPPGAKSDPNRRFAST